LFLAFPVIWPFIAKRIWFTHITWIELGINIFGIFILVSILWFAGKSSLTDDIEIINGSVISKERIHDEYERSYDCRCSRDSKGNKSCDTCYEDHYTVEWIAKMNYGVANETFQFDKLDSTSKRVYNSPDNANYLKCEVGEPASKFNSYKNYIKAVPESLFNMLGASDSYYNQVPGYIGIHNNYRVNRVLNLKTTVPSSELNKLNDNLNKALITLGYKKQVNFIVIVTSNLDPMFRYTVEKYWLGGKKNDVTVFLGMDGNKIAWADVMTFALNIKNEKFVVMLRDELLKVGEFNADTLTQLIVSNTNEHFVRTEMKDFEYLADSIQPPQWIINLVAFLSIFGTIGLSYVMKRIDLA
jgi:hypothetical protein